MASIEGLIQAYEQRYGQSEDFAGHTIYGSGIGIARLNTADAIKIVSPVAAQLERYKKHGIASIILSAELSDCIVISTASLEEAKRAWVQKITPNTITVNIAKGQQKSPKVQPRGTPKKCISLEALEGQNGVLEGLSAEIYHGNSVLPNIKLFPLFSPN